jgi:hypothetical protein
MWHVGDENNAKDLSGVQTGEIGSKCVITNGYLM